ncbi:hypothetical protein MKZ38_008103 [Zalerion maritima]|uniref:Zn(2)-C6 fungal-type domain-containing protein n=1 Tax=Zalerion maritima TaxID=339359 RepID=A0AAD5RUJ3_9PEZI|nr:hypothetical protein MKZ38_008103 [Zalerion maritima]
MRSYAGCWTCRLRRKKCDEVLPICSGCGGLGITCRYSSSKPEWMDGGDRQREMTEAMKREVRLSAARRREGEGAAPVQVFMSGEQDMAATSGVSSSAAMSSERTRHGDGAPGAEDEIMDAVMEEPPQHARSQEHSPPNSNPFSPNNSGRDNRSPAPSSSTAGVTPSSGQSAHDHTPNSSQPTESSPANATNQYTMAIDDFGLDRGYIMLYIDYIFPMLYPFYRPPLLQGGRGWVLELLLECPPLYHTTMCLSAYFFSTIVMSTMEGQGHEGCKELAWQKLLRTTGQTFKVLRGRLAEAGETGSSGNMAHGAGMSCLKEVGRIMGSIVQLQRFELLVASFENCEAHLTAAVSLFEKAWHLGLSAIAHPARQGESRAFEVMLKTLGRGPNTPLPNELQMRAWTYDQASLRFFTAHLIVDDIVLATCLSRPPLLGERYHAELLSRGVTGEEPQIDLAHFMGCENPVMLFVSSIASLDARKKEAVREGRLDMMGLLSEAEPVKKALESHICRLEERARNIDWAEREGMGGRMLIDILPVYTSVLPSSNVSVTFASLLWAHAALIYLTVVLSGWQPANRTIRCSVGRVLELLKNPPSPDLLKTLVWPFCVAGCLAEPGEEEQFREAMRIGFNQTCFFGDAGLVGDPSRAMKRIGTMGTAFEILETVWRSKTTDTSSWDLAKCFGCLGHAVMLV